MRRAILAALLSVQCVDGFVAPVTPFLAPAAHTFSVRVAKQVTSDRSAAQSIVASEVVVDPDYKVAIGFLGVGLAVIAAPYLVGTPLLILGAFLVLQTLRIRFVFDDDAFEVKTKPLDALFEQGLGATGDNFAVGGDNRWTFDSFVNYDFFPSEALPILVYFKEVQTPEEKWDVGPGQWANSQEALTKGAVKGQVHFFPCIAKADVLKEQFVAKGCAKL